MAAHDLVPGSALLIRGRAAKQEYWALNLYLPPGRQAATLAETKQAAAMVPDFPGSLPVLGGGDLNCQLDLPRPGEEELVAELLDWLDGLGLCHMPVLAPTFRRLGYGRKVVRSTTIDALFASAGCAAGKEALLRWTATSSDHAALLSCLAIPAPPRRP